MRLNTENGTPKPMVFLMYHELESPGRELCQCDPGYVRFVVSAADFRAQLGLLAGAGYQGMSVSGASRTGAVTAAPTEGSTPRSGPEPPSADSRLPAPGSRRLAASRSSVVITFDDGCETDLLAAAPLLIDHGFTATFFVVAGFLGRSGYLTEAQAKELAKMQPDIGCHSMTHVNLAPLPLRELRSEIADAKDRLEQVIGQRVDHFSCPYGRWSPDVARIAQEAGYASVSTSRIGSNTARSNPYRLNRVVVLRGSSNFLPLCEGRGLGKLRLVQIARSAVRSVVGEPAYERLKAGLLR